MAGYTEVDTLDEGDVSCTITRRTSDIGIIQHSCKFFRSYVQAGERKTTVWMNPRHLAAVMALIPRVEKAIAEDKES